MKFHTCLSVAVVCTLLAGHPVSADDHGDKPNILVIWGDDIGTWNISPQQPRHDGLHDPQHRPHRA